MTSRKLLLAVPLLVLWQNLHPSASVALIAAAGAACCGWFRFWRTRCLPRPWGESILAVLAGAMMLATPAGVRLFEVAAYNVAISRELGVSEWLPLWDSSNRSPALLVWVTLGVTLVLVWRGARFLEAEDVGRALALTVFMLSSYRFVVFWGLAMIPIWAAAFNRDSLISTVGYRRSLWRDSLTGIAAILVGVVLARWVQPRLFAEHLPLEGVARLRHEKISGVIFCHPPWGGPLIGLGDPDWRVSQDGRYYVYTRQEWRDYLAVARGEVTVADLEKKFHPSAFFLHPNAESVLIELLRQERDWVEIHADAWSVVFVHRLREPR